MKNLLENITKIELDSRSNNVGHQNVPNISGQPSNVYPMAPNVHAQQNGFIATPQAQSYGVSQTQKQQQQSYYPQQQQPQFQQSFRTIWFPENDAQSQLNGAQANQIPPNPKGCFQCRWRELLVEERIMIMQSFNDDALSVSESMRWLDRVDEKLKPLSIHTCTPN